MYINLIKDVIVFKSFHNTALKVQNELIKCLHLDDDFASNVAEKIKAPLSIALTQAIRTVYALPLSNTVGNDAFLAKQLEEEEIFIKDLSRKIFYTYKASEIFQGNQKSISCYISFKKSYLDGR